MKGAHAAQHAVGIYRKVVARQLVAQEIGQAVAVEQLQRHPVHTYYNSNSQHHQVHTMAAPQSAC